MMCWRAAVTLAVLSLSGLPAVAAEFPLAPRQTVIGAIDHYVTKQGDVLPDIARRFDVGYTELAAANPGVDPWLPGAGRTLTIPSLYVLPDAPHRGIVINLAQWRLFYFPPGGDRVETFPLGLGTIGKTTPLGMTRIVYKEPNPTWYPPPSIRAERPDLPAFIPPGPDDPLGAFALHLGWKNYLLHGTNKPDGVGRNVSHGCIRLYPEDIEKLFGEVGVGTPVQTVDQPAAVGWADNALYVAIYPSKTQVQQIDTEKPVTPEPADGVEALVRTTAGQNANVVNWRTVDAAANRRNGMPVRITGELDATQSAALPENSPAYGYSVQSDAAYVVQPAQSADGYAAQTSDNNAQASRTYLPQPYGNYAAQPPATYPPAYPPQPYDSEAEAPWVHGPAYSDDGRPEQSYDRAMRLYDRAQQSGSDAAPPVDDSQQ